MSVPVRATIVTVVMASSIGLAGAAGAALPGEAGRERGQLRSWHVAVDGDDEGSGSASDPFASWQRGIDAARPGDSVLVGPGTYPAGRDGVVTWRSGSRSEPITLRGADPADRPVLDCGDLRADRMICAELDGSWWQISDLDVTGLRQVDSDVPVAVMLDETRRVTIERVAVHDNEGIGIAIIDDSRHNLLRDVDAYRNQDPLSSPPYEHGDGIDLAGLRPTAVGNRVVSSRVWWNADDGIDLWDSEAPVMIRRTWSFRNGYVAGTTEPAGNGQGFKLGRNATGPRHELTRNLAWGNRSFGFDENGAAGPLLLEHNTAYANGGGQYGFYGDELRHVLRNNLAVPDRSSIGDLVDDRWNSWTLPVDAGRRDFRSTSWAGADAPRGPDGELPRTRFLRLRPGSDLVDAGHDLGDPFGGSAPDLGAYERR